MDTSMGINTPGAVIITGVSSFEPGHGLIIPWMISFFNERKELDRPGCPRNPSNYLSVCTETSPPTLAILFHKLFPLIVRPERFFVNSDADLLENCNDKMSTVCSE
jgi:hypothetical protein